MMALVLISIIVICIEIFIIFVRIETIETRLTNKLDEITSLLETKEKEGLYYKISKPEDKCERAIILLQGDDTEDDKDTKNIRSVT